MPAIQTRVPRDENSGQESPEDPFAPRPSFYDQHYHVTPVITYFNIRNKPAQEEFESIVADSVCESLRAKGYAPFFVGFTHAG